MYRSSSLHSSAATRNHQLNTVKRTRQPCSVAANLFSSPLTRTHEDPALSYYDAILESILRVVAKQVLHHFSSDPIKQLPRHLINSRAQAMTSRVSKGKACPPQQLQWEPSFTRYGVWLSHKRGCNLYLTISAAPTLLTIIRQTQEVIPRTSRLPFIAEGIVRPALSQVTPGTFSSCAIRCMHGRYWILPRRYLRRLRTRRCCCCCCWRHVYVGCPVF